MKTTMSVLAALALVAATDVRAQETVGNTVRLADSKDAKVTIVYQHVLPGIPGKSVKGVLVEYGPGATRLRIRTRSRRSSTQPSSRERSAVRSTTDRKKPTAPARTGRNCPATTIVSVPMRARQAPPRFSRSLSLTIRPQCSRYPTKSRVSLRSCARTLYISDETLLRCLATSCAFLIAFHHGGIVRSHQRVELRQISRFGTFPGAVQLAEDRSTLG